MVTQRKEETLCECVVVVGRRHTRTAGLRTPCPQNPRAAPEAPGRLRLGAGSQGGAAVLGWNRQKGHPRARPHLPVPWEDTAGRPHNRTLRLVPQPDRAGALTRTSSLWDGENPCGLWPPGPRCCGECAAGSLFPWGIRRPGGWSGTGSHAQADALPLAPDAQLGRQGRARVWDTPDRGTPRKPAARPPSSLARPCPRPARLQWDL